MSDLAERLIAAHQAKFEAERKSRTIFTASHRIATAIPGERILILPGGARCRISTDASGVATQIEEDEALHAIVRPKAIRRTRPVHQPGA